MNRLPIEILQQICLNLEAPEYCSPRDLASFSQVNHLCNQAAIPILYRNLTLRFSDIETLEAVLSKVTKGSIGIYFKKYARRLSVVCIELPKDCGPKRAGAWRLEPWAIRLMTDRNPATRKGFLEYSMASCLSPTGGHITSPTNINYHESLCETRDWAPVVSLIANLDHLEQFDFVTQNDFTTKLMEAFLQNHPYCKLNIFGGQHMGYVPPDPQVWSEVLCQPEFDMDTLQLPGLHTLTTSFPEHSSSSGGNKKLEEAFPFLFTGPGLKHLCIHVTHSVGLSTMELLKATWQSLVDANEPKHVSPLESLTVRFGCLENLLDLTAAGNISQLRSLDLGIIYPDNLVRVAGLFPNLERLFLNLDTRNAPTLPAGTDVEESILAILAFNPLKYLDVRGIRNPESLDRIIQHHGASLKGLAVVSALGKLDQHPKLHHSEIHDMAIRCPNLEELRLQIPRSEGNQAECEMYKAFGKFRKLHTLFLDLFFDSRPKPPKWSMINVTTDLATLRRTFINAVMDENLALQIWTMIRSNLSCLKNLRLLPVGTHRFPPDESYLHKCFARSYLLSRYNLENPGFPSIEQIGKRAWDAEKEKRDIATAIRRGGELDFSVGVRSVLNELWPQLPKQSDWWTCWTSFPLQPDNDLEEGS